MFVIARAGSIGPHRKGEVGRLFCSSAVSVSMCVLCDGSWTNVSMPGTKKKEKNKSRITAEKAV